MGVIEINWRPDRRQLRQFGVIAVFGFGLIGLVTAWRLDVFAGSGRWTAPVVLWAIGAALGLLGAVAPKAVRPAYVVLMAITSPIGWVVAHGALAVVYFGLFAPIGLVFRLIGRDPLCRQFDPEAETYWTKRPASPPGARYFRQF